MLAYRTGQVARAFGVLDTVSHNAFPAIFLLDEAGTVQVVKVCGRGELCPGGAANLLELVREALGQVQEMEDQAANGANSMEANSKMPNSKVANSQPGQVVAGQTLGKNT
jgi:hypothetical protein